MISSDCFNGSVPRSANDTQGRADTQMRLVQSVLYRFLFLFQIVEPPILCFVFSFYFPPGRLLDGRHSLDELCCLLDMSAKDLNDILDSDPSTLIFTR